MTYYNIDEVFVSCLFIEVHDLAIIEVINFEIQ